MMPRLWDLLVILAGRRDRSRLRHCCASGKSRALSIIPCDLCGSQENLQRQQVTVMLLEWEKRFPGRVETIFNALAHVKPSHLLDTGLFDFRWLQTTGIANPDGDIAFDDAGLSTSGE